MRDKLENRYGQRTKFYGIFERFGVKPDYHGIGTVQTILLKDLRDANKQLVADHLWLTYTKSFQSIDLVPGAVVEFLARVKAYMKGRRDEKTFDYKLSRPTKVKLVSVPTDTNAPQG